MGVINTPTEQDDCASGQQHWQEKRELAARCQSFPGGTEVVWRDSAYGLLLVPDGPERKYSDI